eukprot:910105-Pyramimonas_sp.AAC.1
MVNTQTVVSFTVHPSTVVGWRVCGRLRLSAPPAADNCNGANGDGHPCPRAIASGLPSRPSHEQPRALVAQASQSPEHKSKARASTHRPRALTCRALMWRAGGGRSRQSTPPPARHLSQSGWPAGARPRRGPPTGLAPHQPTEAFGFNSTVDSRRLWYTNIPFSARHFEYSIEYSTFIPCRRTAIGRPMVDSGACPAPAPPARSTFAKTKRNKQAYVGSHPNAPFTTAAPRVHTANNAKRHRRRGHVPPLRVMLITSGILARTYPRRRGPRQGWSTGHKAQHWAAGGIGLPRPTLLIL